MEAIENRSKGKIYLMTDEDINEIVNRVCQGVAELQRNVSSEERGETCNKNDAAKLLGVTRCTVYNMIKDGRIRSTSDGRRVVTESIDEYKNKVKKEPDSFKRSRKGRKSYV